MYEQFFDMKHTPLHQKCASGSAARKPGHERNSWQALLRCGPTTLCRSNSRTRMWKIHFDPTVLRRTS